MPRAPIYSHEFSSRAYAQCSPALKLSGENIGLRPRQSVLAAASESSEAAAVSLGRAATSNCEGKRIFARVRHAPFALLNFRRARMVWGRHLAKLRNGRRVGPRSLTYRQPPERPPQTAKKRLERHPETVWQQPKRFRNGVGVTRKDLWQEKLLLSAHEASSMDRPKGFK